MVLAQAMAKAEGAGAQAFAWEASGQAPSASEPGWLDAALLPPETSVPSPTAAVLPVLTSLGCAHTLGCLLLWGQLCPGSLEQVEEEILDVQCCAALQC